VRRYGFGMNGGGLLLLAFCFLALVGIVLLVVLVLQTHRAPASQPPTAPPGAWPPPQAPQAPTAPPSQARTILDERLARGEIGVEDYQRLRAALDA